MNEKLENRSEFLSESNIRYSDNGGGKSNGRQERLSPSHSPPFPPRLPPHTQSAPCTYALDGELCSFPFTRPFSALCPLHAELGY